MVIDSRLLWVCWGGRVLRATEKRSAAAGRQCLRGFYETAVECKGIPLVFVLLGVFVFAVAFAGTARTLRKIHLGLLYALEESPRTRCLMVSDEDELGLLSKARPLMAKPLSAVTQT